MIYTVDLSNANKITINTSITFIQNDSYWDRAMNFWLIDSSKLNFAQFYIASAVATYTWTRARIRNAWTVIDWTNIGSIWTASYTPTLEIDLVNKIMTWKISWYNNSTYSLTDSDISVIRWLPYLYVYATQHNFYIQDVSITVE